MPNLPFRLADPALLALLVVIPLSWLAFQWIAHRRSSGAMRISTISPLRGVPVGWRVRYRWTLNALRLLAAILVVLALSRPQTGKASARIPAQGVDIVIALDVSGSMLDPGLSASSKLTGAKLAIREFIAQRKNDRVGFVTFESESRVMSPLTLDYRALQQIVDRSDNGLLPDGTAIGLGIADAVNLLRESRAKSRVIILATDGENNQHRLEPEQAADIAKSLKMKLYTIGMFAKGESAATGQIDEKLLRQIAEPTGGFYARAQSGDQLHKIFDTISKLETSQIERQHYTSYFELEGWLLVPAMGLLVLEVVLSGTVFRRTP
ncbi:MAG TPA: VWA domain-containing protein [Dehalococcoidia bacterium]